MFYPNLDYISFRATNADNVDISGIPWLRWISESRIVAWEHYLTDLSRIFSDLYHVNLVQNPQYLPIRRKGSAVTSVLQCLDEDSPEKGFEIHQLIQEWAMKIVIKRKNTFTQNLWMQWLKNNHGKKSTVHYQAYFQWLLCTKE